MGSKKAKIETSENPRFKIYIVLPRRNHRKNRFNDKRNWIFVFVIHYIA